MERNVCNACKLPISEQFLSNVLNKVWHNECVKCCECQETLIDKCFSRNDQIYCKADFDRLFGVRCFGCEKGVTSSDMIRRVNEHIFHLRCLTCSHCNRQIETGEELFKTDENKFLCKSDYESRRKKSMAESSPISDESEDKNTASNGSDDEDGCNGKRRGPRTTIKAKQLETLKSAFAATPKPSRHIREKLAQETGLNMRVIQVWFQNRRSKERRLKQLSVLGGRRPAGRASKHDNRSERDSLEGSSPDSVTASYQFYPTVAPNSLVSTMIEEFNTNRIEFNMGLINNRDRPMIKHEFTSMDVDHSNAFSFVDSLNHETNTVPAYINQHLMASAHMTSAADVW